MKHFDNYDTVVCESCDLIFDIAEAATETDDFGRKAPVCPNCGSGDLTDYDDDYDDDYDSFAD